MFKINEAEQLLSELRDVNIAGGNLATAKALPYDINDFVIAMEKVSEALEKAVITSRCILEGVALAAPDTLKSKAPILPHINISGSVRVIEYNWLHIQLNTLLPHCRFQTPQYLSDTITRLLDCYIAGGKSIPHFENAMLIIDEHCNIQSRTIYDQDNKGWKAVSNALKSRVFPDDDQFHLNVALVSTKSEKISCNIFVINALDAGNFFNTRSEGALYW